MDAKAAYLLAQNLVGQWPQLDGWRVGVSSRMSRTLGKCLYRPKLILLSLSHIRLNGEAIIAETVLHEIAHGVVGPGHGHDRVWRQMAIVVGAEPVSCDTKANMPPGKWIAICPDCAQSFHLYRKPRPDRQRWCRACGPQRGQLFFVPNPTWTGGIACTRRVS